MRQWQVWADAIVRGIRWCFADRARGYAVYTIYSAAVITAGLCADVPGANAAGIIGGAIFGAIWGGIFAIPAYAIYDESRRR